MTTILTAIALILSVTALFISIYALIKKIANKPANAKPANANPVVAPAVKRGFIGKEQETGRVLTSEEMLKWAKDHKEDPKYYNPDNTKIVNTPETDYVIRASNDTEKK